ncbi:MAG: methionyl-tRNA formyltransferase [Patescibacteria group bacterium]|jgi:methionyl-tRNA formyltransferase|nr:methionyl-tRNA formyltransferase [Patescibacteria group bacterium]
MSTNFVFFGSSEISVTALEVLKEKGFLPTLIITKPDAPQGRGLVVTPSPVKVWGEKNNIEIFTPTSLKSPEVLSQLSKVNCPVAVLVSYGKIIPESIINLFPKGILNLHPSLLPLLRGPAPFEYSILNLSKDQIGVSIMLLDKGMDSGDVLAQKKVELADWPISHSALYEILANEGSLLLVETLEKYLDGEISPTPQDHSRATFSKMIEKKDGEITLDGDSYQNYLKFLAFTPWPGIFFFVEKGEKKIRVKVKDGKYEESIFTPLSVIPEGKKEMSYSDFLKGYSI